MRSREVSDPSRIPVLHPTCRYLSLAFPRRGLSCRRPRLVYPSASLRRYLSFQVPLVTVPALGIDTGTHKDNNSTHKES
jgi:hypothetical protein